MAEITNELELETLKAVRADQARTLERIDALAAEMRAVKGHLIALVQSDLSRDSALASLKARVERIERRLELLD
jgi:short-subunit dehydrogenase